MYSPSAFQLMTPYTTLARSKYRTSWLRWTRLRRLPTLLKAITVGPGERGERSCARLPDSSTNTAGFASAERNTLVSRRFADIQRDWRNDRSGPTRPLEGDHDQAYDRSSSRTLRRLFARRHLSSRNQRPRPGIAK